MATLKLKRLFAVGLALSVGVLAAGNASGAVDEDALKRLEQLAAWQQARIEAQARAIEDLEKQVQALSKTAEQKPPAVPAAMEKVPEAGEEK